MSRTFLHPSPPWHTDCSAQQCHQVKQGEEQLKGVRWRLRDVDLWTHWWVEWWYADRCQCRGPAGEGVWAWACEGGGCQSLNLVCHWEGGEVESCRLYCHPTHHHHLPHPPGAHHPQSHWTPHHSLPSWAHQHLVKSKLLQHSFSS